MEWLLRKSATIMESNDDKNVSNQPCSKDPECVVCLYRKISTGRNTKHLDSNLPDDKPGVEGHSNNASTKESIADGSEPQGFIRIVLQKFGLISSYIATFKTLTQAPRMNTSDDSRIGHFIEFFTFFSSYKELRQGLGSLDLQIYFSVLTSTVDSRIIDEFIDLYIDDPLLYEKSEKTKCLYISIFVYIRLKRTGRSTKAIQNKISENAYLFKPIQIFDMSFENDEFIDKFIFNMRKITSDLKESIFLNRYYLIKNKDKNMLESFHKRLIQNIATIHYDNILTFLKYVFTYSTVLFSCITEANLMKLIISFYKNEYKPDQLFNILENLLEKVPDVKINELIMRELAANSLNINKHRRLILKMSILENENFDDFEKFFNKNIDSFDAITLGLDVLDKMHGALKEACEVMKCIQVLVTLANSIKPEFMKESGRISNILTELLQRVDPTWDEFRRFNKDHWDDLSNVVLYIHRVGLETNRDSKKKKKSFSLNQTPLTKSAIKLVEVITDLENRAIDKGHEDLITLKRRGFKLL